jgi:hypothetical protein
MATNSDVAQLRVRLLHGKQAKADDFTVGLDLFGSFRTRPLSPSPADVLLRTKQIEGSKHLADGSAGWPSLVGTARRTLHAPGWYERNGDQHVPHPLAVAFA